MDVGITLSLLGSLLTEIGYVGAIFELFGGTLLTLSLPSKPLTAKKKNGSMTVESVKVLSYNRGNVILSMSLRAFLLSQVR